MLTGLRTMILAAVLSCAVAAMGASITAVAMGRFVDGGRRVDSSRALGVAIKRSNPAIAGRAPTALPVLVAAIPRATATALAWWATTLSGDTYRRVREYPVLTAGDNINWTCTIAGYLGLDRHTHEQLVRCIANQGRLSGRIGGRDIVLRLARAYSRFDGSLDHGAVVVVWGTVMAPYRGLALPATPQVLVYYLAPASHPMPLPR